MAIWDDVLTEQDKQVYAKAGTEIGLTRFRERRGTLSTLPRETTFTLKYRNNNVSIGKDGHGGELALPTCTMVFQYLEGTGSIPAFP